MAPKKKGAKGGGKKKNKEDLESDLKAFNVAERETLMFMYARMRELEEENRVLKQETRGEKAECLEKDEEWVSNGRVDTNRKRRATGICRRKERKPAGSRSLKNKSSTWRQL